MRAKTRLYLANGSNKRNMKSEYMMHYPNEKYEYLLKRA